MNTLTLTHSPNPGRLKLICRSAPNILNAFHPTKNQTDMQKVFQFLSMLRWGNYLFIPVSFSNFEFRFY